MTRNIRNTAQSANQSLSKLRKLRKNALALQSVSYIFLAIAFVRCMLARSVWEPVTLILLSLFLAMSLASVGISAKRWKCPYCGKMLEIKRGAADKTGKCPYCQKEL